MNKTHPKKKNLKKITLTKLKIFTTIVFGMAALSVSQPSSAQNGESPMDHTVVVLETNQGNIEIALPYEDVAPKATENFKKHVEDGYYNGLIFHRVIPNFMIQGGDPTGTGRGGDSIWGHTFENEVSKDVTFEQPGMVAMANTGHGTNASQFFITTVPTAWLNMKYSIFGKVVSGFDVVEKIDHVKTGSGDRPVEEQKIIKAYIK